MSISTCDDHSEAWCHRPVLSLSLAGVVLTRSVPDWVIVIVLFLMMAFLAIKVLAKGRQMYKAENSHHKAAEDTTEGTAGPQPPQDPPAAGGPPSPPAGPPESPPPRLEPDEVQPPCFA